MTTSPSKKKATTVPKPTEAKKAKPAVAVAKVDKKPTFQTLVMEAVKDMNDRHGSSRAAVANYVAKKNEFSQSPKIVSGKVSGALRKCVELGLLTQGHKPGKVAPAEGSVAGSFKINKEAEKKQLKQDKEKAKPAPKKKAAAAPAKKAGAAAAKKPSTKAASAKSPAKAKKTAKPAKKSPAKKAAKPAKKAKAASSAKAAPKKAEPAKVATPKKRGAPKARK